ncbi:hypothetical protein, partial [Arenibacter lacus]|uniref:hypothetical protein n=1 Tax=Arenibacter lacus TaxID=2608629 RepID=UPI001CC38A99
VTNYITMTNDLEQKLTGFDFQNSSVEEIEQLFSQEILGHTRPTINISPDGLFRARIITNTKDKDIQTTKSIWYPNFDEIPSKHHQLNRCSNIGQNFFYSSNYLGAVIKELNPVDGDLVMIGIFHKKFPETKIRSQYAGIEALKANPKENIELKNYKYVSENDKLIEKYISSKFQERVENGEEHKYKSSIAFSNILLKNENINCIIYPSVASDLKSVNYGIKAKFVDEFLYCKSIYVYSIKRSLREFELIPEKYGKRIILDKNDAKNSVIEWLKNTDSEKQQTIKYSL